jgi:uncharacterized protein
LHEGLAELWLLIAFGAVVGLAATAAVGLMMVGALNLISVGFAVLFVGIGADFGIQFSVRWWPWPERLWSATFISISIR